VPAQHHPAAAAAAMRGRGYRKCSRGTPQRSMYGLIVQPLWSMHQRPSTRI
jgi:hypothetical protein